MCAANRRARRYPANLPTAVSPLTVSAVCLGEALVDLTLPTGNSLIDTDELRVRIGGAPLNIAVHLKRTGVDARFLGALSSDGFGDRIRALLTKEGVQYWPATSVDAPTRLAVIDRRAGQPPFRFYGDRTADTRIEIADVETVLQGNVTALYVSSLLMADRSSARVQKTAIQHARTNGDVLVFSDPNPRPSAWPSRGALVNATEWLLRHSHVTKFSLDDARALAWPHDPESLVAHLRHRTSGTIVVTDGSNGSWFESTRGLQHVPAFPVEELDPTGAGDAFFAAVIAGMLRDRQLTAELLRSASDAGARVAALHGTL